MAENHRKTGWGILALCLLISVLLTFNYTKMWKDDVIIPGPGVTKTKWLSDYLPELRGTLGDSRVFIMEGQKPGGTLLVLGGTHADELAACVAALILVEHCEVAAGRVIVMPHNSNSGFTHNYPQEAHPQFIGFSLPNGDRRTFRYGSRTINSVEHWPDPEVYIQYPHKQKYSGEECRNPNRAYPGRMNGTFAERVAFGIQQLVRTEKVDMQVDLHEGQPEYPFINAMSAHPRAQDLVTLATLELQMYDLAMGAEVSPSSFRGLSNLELGDIFPDLLAVISETVNPTQGKMRGITDEHLPVDGIDAFYDKAAELGYLFAPWPKGGSPLKLRVGRNMQELQALCAAFQEVEEKEIVFETIPSYADLMEKGVGYYFNPLPPEGAPDHGFRALPGVWRLITQG
jgi:hypothetical protein